MGRAFLLRLLLGVAPARPEPLDHSPAAQARRFGREVHRTVTVISHGADNVGLDISPPAKLSAEDAARCFNVEQGGRPWT